MKWRKWIGWGNLIEQVKYRLSPSVYPRLRKRHKSYPLLLLRSVCLLFSSLSPLRQVYTNQDFRRFPKLDKVDDIFERAYGETDKRHGLCPCEVHEERRGSAE